MFEIVIILFMARPANLMAVLLAAPTAAFVASAVEVPGSWKLVELPGVLTLRIPPTMSSEGWLSDPKKGEAVLRRAPKGTPDLDYTISQLRREQGLNILKITQVGLNNYMRILVDASHVLDSSMDRATKDPGWGPEDIKVWHEALNSSEFGKAEIATGLRLLTPMQSTKTRIWPYFALRTSYTRQLKTNPPVQVHVYLLIDRGKLIKLMTSYRISERDLWERDIQRAVETIRLYN